MAEQNNRHIPEKQAGTEIEAYITGVAFENFAKSADNPMLMGMERWGMYCVMPIA